jgi:hypothetical protein
VQRRVDGIKRSLKIAALGLLHSMRIKVGVDRGAFGLFLGPEEIGAVLDYFAVALLVGVEAVCCARLIKVWYCGIAAHLYPGVLGHCSGCQYITTFSNFHSSLVNGICYTDKPSKSSLSYTKTPSISPSKSEQY